MRLNLSIATLAVALALYGLAGCSQSERPPKAQSESPVLAKVGDTLIRADDLIAEANRRAQAHRPVPDKETLLQEMVTYEAQLHCARQMGLDQDPQVQREIHNLLVGKLRERELVPRIEAVRIPEAEVNAMYQTNQARFTRKAQVRLAVLSLSTSPTMTDAKRTELRERMQEARRKIIEQPAPGGRGPAAMGFGALAIDYSEDQASRYRGGDIGWLEPGSSSARWPQEVLAAGCALTKGQVSDLIETDTGLYLVMKTDERPSQPLPVEQVKASISHRLLLERRHDAEEAYRQETERLAQTVIYTNALQSVDLPTARSATAPGPESKPPTLPGAVAPGGDQ